MTLSAVPAKESFNTTFAIEYWTDGTKDEKAAVFALIAEHDTTVKEDLAKGDDANMIDIFGDSLPIIPIAGGAAGLVVLLIICCCMKKCKKKTEVGTQKLVQGNGEKEETHSGDENTIDPFSPKGKVELKKK